MNKNKIRNCTVIILLLSCMMIGNVKTVPANEEHDQVANVEIDAYGTAGVTRVMAKVLQENQKSIAVVEQRDSEIVRSAAYEEETEIVEPEISEPVVRYEEVPEDATMYVTTSYLNLRAEPNTDAEVLDVLTCGDQLHLIGTMKIYVDESLIETWSHVTIDGMMGYVHSSYISSESPYIDMGSFTITYYCPCAICCGWETGITASGTPATAGVTIAADESIPFGTELVIDGHVYTVQDRGGKIKGNRIDIFCNSHLEALSHSVHTSEVYMMR